MAKQIVSAINLKARVREGTSMQLDIVDLLVDATKKVLFSKPGIKTEEIKRDIMRLMRSEYLPQARKSGRKSAIPVLDSVGGEEAVQRASRLSGVPKSVLSAYSRNNANWLVQEINTGTVALSSELKAELARGARDGVNRRQLITDWVNANKAELKQQKKVRKRLSDANKAVAKAESSGDLKAIKAAKNEARKAKAATQRVSTAMGRLEKKVQGEARDAVRREQQQAQLASYKQAGYRVYTWVAVGGSLSCPDCNALHNETRKLQEWHGSMPGDGHTVCLDSCICELVPQEFITKEKPITQPVNPYLKQQLPKPKAAPAPTPAVVSSATRAATRQAAQKVTKKAPKLAKVATKPKAPKFTPAKTVKEAEEWANNNLGVKATYGPRTSVEFANETNRTVQTLQAKYPQAAKKLTEINFTNHRSGALAWADDTSADGGSILNVGRYFSEHDKKMFAVNQGTRKGLVVHADKIEGTITHEFGHMVDAIVRDTGGRDSASNLWRHNTLKGIHSSGVSMPSEYAKTGGYSEMFAESFTEIQMTPRAQWSQATKAVAKYLQEADERGLIQ